MEKQKVHSLWLYEAVVQRGTNDLYGDAPSDMGTDNEDSILANDEYGQDKDEKNLVKEDDFEDDFESERRRGPQGEIYIHPEGGKYGWRRGDKDGYNSNVDSSTANYFITDGKTVLEWGDHTLWDAPQGEAQMVSVWEEWIEYVGSRFGPKVNPPPQNFRKRAEIEEAEPVRSELDIKLLRKLGYSEDRIARIDRAESETIIMHRIPANKLGENKMVRNSDFKEKEEAFWTEVNENLFTKASMALGKTFLPSDDNEVEDEEDIEETSTDPYNKYMSDPDKEPEDQCCDSDDDSDEEPADEYNKTTR